MVTTVKKKVSFYALQISGADEEICNDMFFNTLDYITTQMDSSQRTFECPCELQDKRCVLDFTGYADNDTALNMLFSVGRINYRPPYRRFEINFNFTGAEPERRDNAKELNEAEEEYVHLVTKRVEDDIILAVEYNRLLTIKTIKAYIEHYINLYCESINITNVYTVDIKLILDRDFMSLLNGVERATTVELIIDSQLIGNPFLNFAERENHIKRDIKIITKAERAQGINIQWIRALAGRYFEHHNLIKMIKVSGIDEENEKIAFNTDSCVAKYAIDVTLDDATRIPTNHQRIFNDIRELFHKIMR